MSDWPISLAEAKEQILAQRAEIKHLRDLLQDVLPLLELKWGKEATSRSIIGEIRAALAKGEGK